MWLILLDFSTNSLIFALLELIFNDWNEIMSLSPMSQQLINNAAVRSARKGLAVRFNDETNFFFATKEEYDSYMKIAVRKNMTTHHITIDEAEQGNWN